MPQSVTATLPPNAGLRLTSRFMSIGGKGAELVLVNGKIRTPSHPSGFTQAVAISGGVVLALGTDDEIRDLTGPFTRVIDLRGRLAIPAFGDAHVHPIQGGLESLRCNLARPAGRAEYLATIAAYSATLPPGAWVLGGGWSMPAFPGGTPAAASLDAVTGGRPAFLPNRDHHTRLGEQRCPGPGRHHQGHARPGRRADRARLPGQPDRARCTTARCGWSPTTCPGPARTS